MLYDVLPPLVFFVSLGGLILVVSRVIVRIKREQFASDIRAHTTAIGNQTISNSSRVNGVLSPSSGKITAIKTPFALIKHFFVSFSERVKSDRSYKKEQKEIKNKQKKSNLNARSILGSIKLSRTNNTNQDTDDKVQKPQAPLREKLSNFSDKAGVSLKHRASSFGKLRPSFRQKMISDSDEAEQTKPKWSLKRKSIERQKDHVNALERKKINKTVVQKSNTDNANIKSAVMSVKKTTQKVIKSDKKFPLKRFKSTSKTERQESSAIIQAEQALSTVNFEQVEEILIPYIMEHPKDAKAYMLLGQAAEGKEDWDDAIQAFEYVANINPKTKGCLAHLGHATYKAGRMTKAVELLQKAHAAEPKNIEVIKELITIARQLDNTPMQNSLMEELSDLEPETEEKELTN